MGFCGSKSLCQMRLAISSQRIDNVLDVFDRMPAIADATAVTKQMRRLRHISTSKVVSTDPPYYDNIGYADLSDFFYVWLRTIAAVRFPDLFATITVPKAEELVATPYRHGSKEKAEAFFLNGMTQAMQQSRRASPSAFPVTIYYAFKQSETDDETARHQQDGRPFLTQCFELAFN